MSNKVGKDLVSNPQLVAEPDLAVEVSAIYWYDRIRNGLNLNQWADQFNLKERVDSTNNWKVHENITRAINGGTNGIDDRASRMQQGWEIVDEITDKIKRNPFIAIMIGLSLILGGIAIYQITKK
jgi:predicted chitinase